MLTGRRTAGLLGFNFLTVVERSKLMKESSIPNSYEVDDGHDTGTLNPC